LETTIECIPCLVKQGIKTAKYLGKSDEVSSNMLKEILEMLSKENYKNTPPFLAKKIHKIIVKHTETEDPYKEIKKHYNQKIMNMEDGLKRRVDEAENKILEAVKLAITGNIIDFGTENEITEKLVKEHIDCIEQKGFEQKDFSDMYNELRRSKRLLYIGDNCGEIVFDKILVEQIKKEFPNIQVYFGVRGKPIINDITHLDAKEVGMDSIATIIDNGDGAPGVVMEDISEEYKKLFYGVDMVIAKGQGNYETLNEIERDNLYFLFMAKCNVVADGLGVKTGTLMCKKNI
jgi:uncharacterized protein with ATP-grasp and redox domains